MTGTAGQAAGSLRVALWLAAGLFACAAAHGAIAFRAAASAVAVVGTPALVSYCLDDNGSGGAATMTLTANSSTVTGGCSAAAPAAGDVLIAHIVVRGQPAITTPAGWLLIRSDSTANVTSAAYWKVAASPSDSGTWTFSVAARASGGIAAYRSLERTGPVSASGGGAATNSKIVTAPSQTQMVADSMAVALFATANGNSTLSTATGMTQAYQLASRAGQKGVAFAQDYELRATTGGTGNKTSTTNNSADNVGQLLVLRPTITLTIAMPTGTVVGDVMIATIAYRDSTVTMTPPSGWTQVNTVTQPAGGANGMRLTTYSRVAGAAEPASYTWSFPGGAFDYAVGGITSFSGVDNTTPVDTSGAQAAGNGTSYTFATPSVTPSSNGAMLVGGFAYMNADSWTPPTGYTEAVDARSPSVANATGLTLEMAYLLQTTAAAVSASATASNTYPADRGATQLLALRPAAVGPHHYELSVPSASVSCVASTVIVKACADSSSPCTSTYAGASGTMATLGASAGNLGAATIVFDATGVATTTLSHPTAANSTSVGVTLSGQTLAASNSTQCCADGVTCSVANSCSSTFNTAGFIFGDTANGAQSTIAAQTAGSAAQTSIPGPFYLRAVKTNTTTKACEAALSGTSSVSLGYQCNNPSSCSSGNYLDITPYNGAAAQTTQTVAPGGSAVNLYFDGNGNAPLTFSYRDVGNITLTANKAAGGNLLASLSGSSNAFVVAPHHFGFSNVTAGPLKAGVNFAATVTAYTSGNSATPNFGRETTPEGVSLSCTRYQPTGTGAVNGVFSGSVGGFSNGSASGTNLNWSEVGTIDLTAALTGGSYLGSGLTATGTTGATGAVGRFTPHHFDVVVTNACSSGGFTYAGQPMSVKISAMNGLATPTVTQNYDGTANTNPNFAMAVTLSELLTSAATGTLTANGVAASSFASGVANASPIYTFANSPTVPTTVQLRAVDNDAVSSSGYTEGTAAIRSGRLRLTNSYGSELLALPVPLEAQYWTAGGYYTRNTDDSCTGIPMSSLILGGYLGALTACKTQITPSATQTLLAGRLPGNGLVLTAPGAGFSGSVDLTLNTGTTAIGQTCLSTSQASATASALTWLGPAPTARATFGIYKSRVIYSRENY